MVILGGSYGQSKEISCGKISPRVCDHKVREPGDVSGVRWPGPHVLVSMCSRWLPVDSAFVAGVCGPEARDSKPHARRAFGTEYVPVC